MFTDEIQDTPNAREARVLAEYLTVCTEVGWEPLIVAGKDLVAAGCDYVLRPVERPQVTIIKRPLADSPEGPLYVLSLDSGDTFELKAESFAELIATPGVMPLLRACRRGVRLPTQLLHAPESEAIPETVSKPFWTFSFWGWSLSLTKQS